MPKPLIMREHQLLLNSEVIKQFPDIHKILLENEEITDAIVSRLSEKQQNFFENMLPAVLKQAISEWKGDDTNYYYEDKGPDKSKWLRCSLDNNPNRHIFYIYNQLNGITLNVGSECIKHFWGNEKLDGKSIGQIKKEGKKLRLLNELNNILPGIVKTIENWDFEIEKYEIIIPDFLEKPYYDLGKKARSLLEIYCKGKAEDTYVEDFKQILSQRDDLIHVIDNYVSENKHDKFVLKKNIKTWLLSRRNITAFNLLKEDGKITWRTAWRIDEPKFMKSIIKDLNGGLKNIGLEIIDIDTDRSGYVLRSLKNKNILLFCKHDKLINYCGWIVFGNKPDDPFTLEHTFTLCTLYNDKSIEEVILSLGNAIKGSGIVFRSLKIDIDQIGANEIDIYDSNIDKYILGNLQEISEKFKGLAVGIDSITKDDLLNYINNLPDKQRYSKAELRDLLRMRKEISKRI